MARTPKRSTLSNELIARYPVTLSAADLLASAGAVEDQPEPIDFTPVPRRRNRRGGWTEQTQRDFIACLQLTGSVAASARAVGMSARTAYRLLEVEGADSFAIAWDKAFEEGRRRTQEDSLGRALNGSLVPIYRHARLVRVEHRRNDRLAIALLGARDRNIDWYRQGALRRHVCKLEMQQRDAELVEKRAREAEAQRAYDEELQRMLDKAAEPRIPRMAVI